MKELGHGVELGSQKRKTDQDSGQVPLAAQTEVQALLVTFELVKSLGLR